MDKQHSQDKMTKILQETIPHPQYDSKPKKSNKAVVFNIIIIMLTLMSALLIYIAKGVVQEKNREQQYAEALQKSENKDYEGAMEIFLSLGNYKDSISQYLSAYTKLDKLNRAYEYAQELYAFHQYIDAIAAFEEIIDFRDSKDEIEEIKNLLYTTAIEYFNDEDFENALSIFSELKDYKDSQQRAEKAKEEISDARLTELAYQTAVNNLKLRKYQLAIEQFIALGDYKDSLNLIKECEKEIHKYYKTISAGIRYSMAIKDDGSIVWTGDGAQGQCNVSEWKKEEIVSLSCFSAITIGLKSDGTVIVSTNRKDIDVNAWSDIIAVSAGESYVVGLKSDGTVVGCGHDSGDGQLQLANWSNIVAIATGWRHTVGLTADGLIYISGYNSTSQLRQISSHQTEWSNIVAIAAGGGSATFPGKGHTVGLRADGTVVAVGDNSEGQCNVKDWVNVVAIAAGDTHTIGLRSDGKVYITDEAENTQTLIEGWSDIVAISASEGYSLGLKSDGTVLSIGYNAQNQRPESGEWTNIKTYSDWIN